jgi:hypothetical protein
MTEPKPCDVCGRYDPQHAHVRMRYVVEETDAIYAVGDFKNLRTLPLPNDCGGGGTGKPRTLSLEISTDDGKTWTTVEPTRA